MINVLIADDHPLFRRGLCNLLEDEADIRVVAEAASSAQAVEQALALKPDVILMDVNMPGGGVAATRAICQTIPSAKILMLTVSEENDSVFGAINAGASGYLLKEVKSEELIDAVRRTAKGLSVLSPAVAVKVLQHVREQPDTAPSPEAEVQLTPRETEIIGFIAQGLTNQTIAQKLALSESTVKNHLRNILRKTHARSRTEAITWAIQRGLL